MTFPTPRLAASALALLFAGCLLAAPSARSAQAVLAADDFRLLPARFHLLRSRAVPALHCNLGESDAARILGKVNGIWKQAGIQFYAEGVLTEDAASEELYRGLGENRTEAHLRLVRPRASLSERTFHLYYVAEMRPNGICLNQSYQLLFIKASARLHPVPGGLDEPLPRVSAHEVGHALDLPHRQDVTNLMASGTTGTGLNQAEIETARAAAERFAWCLRPEAALEQAEAATAGRPTAARALYTALAGLPGGDVARRARERLAAGSGR